MRPQTIHIHDDASHALELLELGDAFLEVDREWRVLRANANQEKLSRRPRSEVVGRALWEIWPEMASPETPGWRECHRCMHERVPVQFDAYDGPLDLWASVTAYPTSTGIAVFSRDITERKRAEETLREADRRGTEFLRVLSHELRNPLAPIRNSVQVLERADPSSDHACRARTIIARQVEHLGRLVDDLLDVQRISTGKLRLRRNRMDLARSVRDAVEDLRPLFTSRSLALELRMPPGPVWVNGDPTRLAQVVTNLLQNAAKFTDPGGHVRVTVDGRDGNARLTVRDDGLGVAPGQLEQLFEPFVQSETTLHRSRGGLGLGLSLVRGITALHGGTVSARSEGIGKGAEFALTLPAIEPVPAVDVEIAATEPGSRHRVLVIEDGEDAAESLRDLLELAGGHEVTIAKDGPAGVEAARRLSPDVVVCDVGLPGFDGNEVARRIRAAGAASRARLIALSGYASPEDVERALRAGFDYHLPKPPDVEAILSLVATAPGTGAPAALPPDMVTGHHEVDSQHASILAHVARVREADLEEVWDSLRFLQEHTARHFAYEEMLMEDVSYPRLSSHKRNHLGFADEFRALKERLKREGPTCENVAALASAVETWVIEHVLAEDRHLAAFIRREASND